MISKGKFVTELHDGDSVGAVFLVSERRVLVARNGKPYAKLLLTDKTGDVQGMIWEDARAQVSGIEPGDVVGVRGAVESYEGRPQMKVEKIVKLKEEEVDMSALVPTVKGDTASMREEVEQIIQALKNSHLKELLGRLFLRDGIKDAFVKAPAAKGIHHNYIGGLLEHTLTVLKSIEALYPVYRHLCIPAIS